MKEREGMATGAASLSILQGVMHINGEVTLDEIKTSILTEMRRKANAKTMENVVVLRPLSITCIFSIKIMKMSRKEGAMRV